MTRITLHTFDEVLDAVDLAPGTSLRVGRRPERSADAQLLEVPLPSVSSSHVEVRVTDALTHIEDLGSKNGTWLKLAPHQAVQVSSAADVALYLALPASRKGHDDLPEDAVWSGADDFAGSVTSVLEDWLEERGVPARIMTAERPKTPYAVDDPGMVPLAIPIDLHVVPLRTTEARWPEVLSQVWRYVERQNDLFATEQELRRDGIVLASPVMRRVYRSVVDAARRGLRLLLLGPSGAGKEVLARCYHRHTGRSGAFVARNCALLSKEFLRAELFGAERGSFTGSVQRITGAVERAQGGTLFLDEIGELGLDMQAMLLRFLDSGDYERLGQFGTLLQADVGIVSATNKDLRASCARGDFRSDLWYRLSIQVVDVPPLRDRVEDIVAYLKTHPVGRPSSAFDRLSAPALELICGHSWDGNFRELANFTERMSDGPPGGLSAQDCQELLAQGTIRSVRSRPSAPAVDSSVWADLATRAARAYSEDHADQPPRIWDDVKEYIEKYLKPLLFAQLSQIGPSLEATDLRACADRMAADRATALKQIERYFDRLSEG